MKLNFFICSIAFLNHYFKGIRFGTMVLVLNIALYIVLCIEYCLVF